eukprot:RCo002797
MGLAADRVQALGASKVRELHGSIVSHQNVVPFDVPVHHLVAVQVLQPQEDLPGIAPNGRLGEAFELPVQVLQASSRDVLQENLDGVGIGIPAAAVVADDVLVLVLAHQVDLFPERVKITRGGGFAVAQLYQLHRRELAIVQHSEEHRPEATLAQHGAPPPGNPLLGLQLGKRGGCHGGARRQRGGGGSRGSLLRGDRAPRAQAALLAHAVLQHISTLPAQNLSPALGAELPWAVRAAARLGTLHHVLIFPFSLTTPTAKKGAGGHTGQAGKRVCPYGTGERGGGGGGGGGFWGKETRRSRL